MKAPSHDGGGANPYQIGMEGNNGWDGGILQQYQIPRRIGLKDTVESTFCCVVTMIQENIMYIRWEVMTQTKRVFAILLCVCVSFSFVIAR